MPLTQPQIDVLRRDLRRSRVRTRSGMSYLEAYDIKAMLIRVFGYGGFSVELLEHRLTDLREVPQRKDPSKVNWQACYEARVRLTIHGIRPDGGDAVYTEAAVGFNSQPDMGEALDTALKSAESDALKRAAIMLGTQFGLSLYAQGATQDVVRVVVPYDSDDSDTASTAESATASVDGEQDDAPARTVEEAEAMLNRSLANRPKGDK